MPYQIQIVIFYLNLCLLFTIWTFSNYFTILANTLKLVFAICTPRDSLFITWFKIFVEIIRDGFDSFFSDRATRKNIKRHFAVLGSVKWIISFRYIIERSVNTKEIHTCYILIRLLIYRLLSKQLKRKKNKYKIPSFELLTVLLTVI